VHGTDAYAEAVRRGIELARRTAARIEELGAPLRLVMQPQLSVLLFEREGWTRADWDRWAAAALDDGLAFVAPTTWQGRPAGRLAFLHPDTPWDVVEQLLDRAAERF